MAFPLTKEQLAVVDDRGGELLVSAAAGSGKTRVLVERLLKRVMTEGLDIDRFLVITYTKAAAAELRARIVDELAQRMAEEPHNRHLRRQSTLVYKAQISTIHSFCSQLLRESGHLLDLDPDFRLSDEGEAGVLRLQAIEEVLEERYETIEEDSPYSKLVETLSAGRDDSKLAQITLDIYGRVQAHAHPKQWLKEQLEAFRLEGITDVGQTIWGTCLLENLRRQASYWTGQMKLALENCQFDSQLEEKYAPSLAETYGALESLCLAMGEGWDAAVAQSTIPFPKLGAVRGCENPEIQEQVKSQRERCKKRMTQLAQVLEQNSQALLEEIQELYPVMEALFALVEDFGTQYTAIKRRRGVLDFSDLEHMAVALLVQEDGSPSPLATSWSLRYEELMVDEYQDTNQVQNAIFLAVSREGRNLFQVGDVKQSIYRFRLADPTIFLGKYRSFVQGDQAESGQPRRRMLSKNFRSRPQVLEGANFLFRNLMSQAFGEMDYGAEEALYPGAKFQGDPEDYKVELDALDLSQGEEETEGLSVSKDLLEARFVSRRIHKLLKEQFPVSDKEGTRPVRSSDIVVLLRSPNTVLHHYAKAFAEVGLAWEAEGGEDFFQSVEVSVALSFLQIIDNPRQDVPLISVLRSPIYGFTPDRLALLRAKQKEEDFYSCLKLEEDAPDCQAFLGELDQLREQASELSCHQLLWQIYDQSHLLGVFSAMEEGESHRGRLLALAECARQFEGSGHKGLFGFLTHLGRVREQGGKLSGPSGGREGVGVRLMSIHRSKGLEFPVVILAGLAKLFNKEDLKRPILFHPKLGVGPKGLDLERMVYYPTLPRQAVSQALLEEMLAEELRLLYVAMTRAREKLILICSLRRGAKELAQLASDSTSPVNPQILSESTSVCHWILLATLGRPDSQALCQATGAQPNCRLSEADCTPLWDIRWEEGTELRNSVALAEASQPQETEEVAGQREATLLAQLAWQYPHRTEVNLPSKLTATQVKGRTIDEEVVEDTKQTFQSIPFHRPTFAQETLGLTAAQKGSALHLAVQHLDFDRSQNGEAIRSQLKHLVEKQLMTEQQAKAVPTTPILHFLKSPLGQELLQAPQVYREYKFSLLVPASRYYPEADQGEEVLFQGVIDCWYETLEGITLVDFKTDRVTEDTVEERAEHYRPQLEAYAMALEQITGKRVCHKLLWFFSMGMEKELGRI